MTADRFQPEDLELPAQPRHLQLLVRPDGAPTDEVLLIELDGTDQGTGHVESVLQY